MQKFCSLYQAQALEAFWVICHHCHALQCLHPLLATHKSCFQSNQTESWVSLAADFALWASGCLCVVCLCWSAGAWIVRVIDTSTGQRAEPGVGISNLLSLESLWRALGWQGTAAKPSQAFVQWFGGHDSARGSWVSVQQEIQRGMYGRCSSAVGHTAGQHGALPLGDNGAGSLSCALQTDFCHGIINSGPVIIVLLMENAEKSTAGAKPSSFPT